MVELRQMCAINDVEIVSVVFIFQLFHTFLCFFAQVMKLALCLLVHQRLSLIPPFLAEMAIFGKRYLKSDQNFSLPHLP